MGKVVTRTVTTNTRFLRRGGHRVFPSSLGRILSARPQPLCTSTQATPHSRLCQGRTLSAHLRRLHRTAGYAKAAPSLHPQATPYIPVMPRPHPLCTLNRTQPVTLGRNLSACLPHPPGSRGRTLTALTAHCSAARPRREVRIPPPRWEGPGKRSPRQPLRHLRTLPKPPPSPPSSVDNDASASESVPSSSFTVPSTIRSEARSAHAPSGDVSNAAPSQLGHGAGV